MRLFVPGLLLVIALGCGGFDQLLAQSFDEAFVETCMDDHAKRVANLQDPQAACACAKEKVEAQYAEPMERLAVIADVDQMQVLLEACNTPAEAAVPEEAPEEEGPVEVEAPEAPAP
ncbi:MAG: hypothetical protein AAGA48_17850 [Myxococcota bacterium]